MAKAGFKPTSRQQFRNHALRQIAEWASVNSDALVRLCDTASQSVTGQAPAVVTLLTALANLTARSQRAEVFKELLQTKNTPRLVTLLRQTQPRELADRPHDEQISCIRLVLKTLSIDDAHRYPLLPHQSDVCTITEHSAAHHALADQWLGVVSELLAAHYNRKITLSARQRLGLLIVRLALIDGVICSGEQRIVLQQLAAGRIRRHGPLLWTSGTFEPPRMEYRRQFLSPETVALASSIAWDEILPNPEATSVMRAALASLARLHVALINCRVRHLRKVAEDRHRLTRNVPHFLVDFMTGEAASSALTEHGLARLLGRSAAELDNNHEATELLKDVDGDRISPHSPDAQDAGVDESPSKKENAITTVSRLLKEARPGSVKNLIPAISAIQAGIPAEYGLFAQVLDCVKRMLATGRQPSTVKIFLSNLRARLFAAVDDFSEISDPDDWAELVDTMTHELSRKNKAWTAISQFGRYLSEVTGDEFITVGESTRSQINAQLVTYQDLRDATNLLTAQLGPERGDLAALLMTMSATTSMRRREVDGLLASDVRLGDGAYLHVRKNEYRALKTSNAQRMLPLDLLTENFPDQYQLLSSIHTRITAEDSERLLFEGYGYVPIKDPTLFNNISATLQVVTGQQMSKTHSLRHSYCCYLFLALYYDRLGLDRYRVLFPFLKEVEAIRETIISTMASPSTWQRFEPGIVRLAMGHLSASTSLQHYFHLADLMRAAALGIHAGVSCSDATLLGALGFNRNSRSLRGGVPADAAVALEKRLSETTHELPPALTRTLDNRITEIHKGKDLISELRRVMHYARDITPASSIFLPIFGQVPDSEILAVRSWVDTHLVSKSIGREVPEPYDDLRDVTARQCLTTMISNLSLMSQDQLVEASRSLRAMLEQQSGSYLSFCFNSVENYERAVGTLKTLLTGYEARYKIRIERRVGRRYELVHEELYEHLQCVTAFHDCRYRLKILQRPQSSFPHRALIWLTISLSLACSSIKLKMVGC